MGESKVPDAIVKLLDNGGIVYSAMRDTRFDDSLPPIYRESISAGVPAELQGKKPVLVFARDDKTVIIQDALAMERIRGFLIGIHADGVISPEERAAASRVISDALDDGKLQGGVPTAASLAKAKLSGQ